MGPLRVVFDTNVLVSALGFGGTPFEALLRAFDDDVTLLASDDTLDEFERVLGYDRLSFTELDRERYPAIVEREADLVTPELSLDVVERDPDDNKFLECAVGGDATYLVSGDTHLLDIGSFRNVEVVTASEFLDRVG